MGWRVVAKPANPKGLLIGWLIGHGVDNALRLALPGWAIVVNAERDLSVTSREIETARRLGGCSSDVPWYLAGWSAGCQSVRSALLAGQRPAGVALFDGTAADYPKPQPWQIQVWADAAARARAGEAVMVATCTSMTYTETLGSPYMATRHVLERALGQTLELDKPIREGLLYVERFPSPLADGGQEHRDQVNVHMPRLLAEHFGKRAAPAPVSAPSLVPLWLQPALRYGLRCLAWSHHELAQGVKELTDNDSPRIREYFSLAFMRKGKAIKVRGAPWCAAAACFAHHTCALPGDTIPTHRVSGLELENDAKEKGTWVDRGEPGDLAIFKRKGAAWFRHVTRIMGWEDDHIHFWTIGGNEGDTWAQTRHAITDADYLGSIRVV
jgi:hypothetical protein